MKITFTAFFLLLTITVLRAQQLFFQDRFYKMDATGKAISASVLLPQNQVLLSGPVDGACGWCGKNNFLLINKNLDTIWTRIGIETSRQEQDMSLIKGGNGYVFTGTINNPNVPAVYRYDMLLQKFDLNGHLLWSKSFNARADVARAVVTLSNGGYMLGGLGMDPNLDKGFTILLTDSQGNVVSRKSYDWSSYDLLNTMRLTHNGNIIVAGVTKYPYPEYHLKLMLLNQNGDSLKGGQLVVTNPTRKEGARNPDNAVLSLSDGGFLITGTVDTLQFSGLGMIIKVDSNLQPVWKYIYRSNPSVWKQFSRVTELADGTILALAYQADPHISNQFWLEHFSATGQLIHSYPFTSNITNKLDAITLEALPDSSFIIGGCSYNAVQVGSQLTTHYGLYVARVKIPGLAKAVTVTGVKQDVAQENVSLGQSYPNPATETAIIPYQLPVKFKQAQIQIRDITGRELGNYIIKPGNNILEVNLSNFGNGLYTYTLLVDEKPVATKKLAVMK